jgi:predicted alpha/beta-fold hydrolase
VLPALDEIAHALESKPFRPHRLFRGSHAQTLAGFAWPHRLRIRERNVADEPRLFEVEPGVCLLAHCRWQNRDGGRGAHPTVLLVHGLEGSSESVYILSTAQKAYAAGFNVLRVNMRNCGGTEHLTPTLYNSGMSDDFRQIVNELIECDELRSIFLVGFSMGGNIVLKLAGEFGGEAPRELSGVCAVSPALDLKACADAIQMRSNWLYQRRFMRSLRRRVRHKEKLYPALYDTRSLRSVRTIRDFDERYTAAHGGYSDAADYYERASALRLIARINRPTLIIHALDDPFVPFTSFRHPSIAANPSVILLAPPRGGHVGFVADDAREDEDRFWAENRVIEFCTSLHQLGEKT